MTTAEHNPLFVDATRNWFQEAIENATTYYPELRNIWDETIVADSNTDTLVLMHFLSYPDGHVPLSYIPETKASDDYNSVCNPQYQHTLYDQRAIVLRWALYIFSHKDAHKLLTTEQFDTFSYHVEALKMFCSDVHLKTCESDKEAPADETMKDTYSIVVPPQYKGGESINVELPQYSPERINISVTVPDHLKEGDAFYIHYDRKTRRASTSPLRSQYVTETTNLPRASSMKRKFDVEENDFEESDEENNVQKTTHACGLRRSKRIREKHFAKCQANTANVDIEPFILGC